MSRDKQIEEMRKDLIEIFDEEYNKRRIITADFTAIHLTAKDYRKASEVAEEIFAEIEQNLNNLIRYYKVKRKYVTEIEYSEFEQRYCDIKIRTFEERLLKIAELKKKYTEEGK